MQQRPTHYYGGLACTCRYIHVYCVLLAVTVEPSCSREQDGSPPMSPPAPPQALCNSSEMCAYHEQCSGRQCVCDHGYSGADCENGDLAALLAFNQVTRDPQALLAATWRCPRCIHPCGTGWNDPRVGFVGIMCNRVGRVSYLNVLPAVDAVDAPACDLSASIHPLASLLFMETIVLQGCTNVHGNVEVLSVLRRLRYLNLCDTSVHGTVGSLLPLLHLGEIYRAADGSGGTGLYLARTHVHGRVDMLRSLPGLETWGSLPDHFSSCEAWAAPTRTEIIEAGGRADSGAQAEGLYACIDEDPVPLGSSCDSSLACTAGNDACACCPYGVGGEYNVSYDSATGVCTVSDPKTYVQSFLRPWTGKLIRDSEGLIFLLFAILVCVLLARMYIPLKGNSMSSIFEYWMQHSNFNADPTERTDRIARREAEQLQPQAFAQARPTRAIRPAEFVFGETSAVQRQQLQGSHHDAEDLERHDASPQGDVNGASATDIGNPLHTHPADV